MSFSRTQVTWLCWHCVTHPSMGRDWKNIPPRFARRVTSLIDIGAGVSPLGQERRPGVSLEFSFDDVFEIWIALQILNAGVPRAEAVAFVLKFRAEIRGVARRLNNTPPRRLYIIVKPLVLQETLGIFAVSKSTTQVPFEPPVIVESLEELAANLDTLYYEDPLRIVIEVTDLHKKLSIYLQSVPVVKRGPA